MPAPSCTAFAPGRVNVIGEHTDYNGGLALPFAIAEGVTVHASARRDGRAVVRAQADDLQESDEFPLSDPQPTDGWRAFVRGACAELAGAGHPLRGTTLRIGGDVPRGAGLSSSAALTVSLCLSLLQLGSDGSDELLGAEGRVELAGLCSRIEHDWTGAQTGLLDQLASLFGAAETALYIDFQSLEVEPVPLRLEGWRFVLADSGERHAHASSGYNERREECAQACRLLGIAWLSEAGEEGIATLPEPLRRRASHVLGENERVRLAAAALREGEIAALGPLLEDSHASLRDLYEISTPAVEATVAGLLDAGAAGARLMGGGFGGAVLGLLSPQVATPQGCLEVRPGPGARVIDVGG